MKIGWIGLGKLGLPCALVQAQAGHQVIGTDVNQSVKSYLRDRWIPYQESGVLDAFEKGVQVGWRDSIVEVVNESEIIFVAVQTPHAPAYEGCSRTPDTTRDFEYGFLTSAFSAIERCVSSDKTVVIVSTVLPGTCGREIVPIAARNKHLRLVYSPAFIAMGTTMDDYRNPEMVIVGTDDDLAFENLKSVYAPIHDRPLVRLSIIECEFVKMAYNTFIGMKIVFGNALGELCEKLGGNSDNVLRALSLATDRLISAKYMKAGLGDGGGCHPRDQLALSWLAERTNLSSDIFGWLMRTRDDQTAWIASLAIDASETTSLPICVLGAEYKPNTNLTIGSPSRLLMSFLPEKANWADESNLVDPAVYIIGVNHSRYISVQFPTGSYVIDPWGFIPDQDGVIVRRIGRH